MQRNVVECVTKTKFLGVIIDNKLEWNDHITYVKSKISKTIGLFYKMRQYLGRTAHISSNIQIDVSYTSFKCVVKTYIHTIISLYLDLIFKEQILSSPTCI